ncbi:MbtH family protein [Streptomyces aculeolatus]|jgi:MbtH protein|uniref:MbtH family protein n=1 Tax=Streptomyces aculeolatus TaxID=270689 RepID=UPI00102BF0E1|nr:MbtH family NRPS accessory protein [Streptomyces aculeolatus]
MTDAEDDRQYDVVVNDEEQYSIWFAGRDLPPGWSRAGHTGTRQDCLDHIDRVWTDIRPLSVRRGLEETGGDSAA